MPGESWTSSSFGCTDIITSRYIVGVDINDGKFTKAVEMGATECVNSITCEGGDVKAWLLGKEKWGYDYTYDCTGNVMVMRTALEVAHRGWGEAQCRNIEWP